MYVQKTSSTVDKSVLTAAPCTCSSQYVGTSSLKIVVGWSLFIEKSYLIILLCSFTRVRKQHFLIIMPTCLTSCFLVLISLVAAFYTSEVYLDWKARMLSRSRYSAPHNPIKPYKNLRSKEGHEGNQTITVPNSSNLNESHAGNKKIEHPAEMASGPASKETSILLTTFTTQNKGEKAQLRKVSEATRFFERAPYRNLTNFFKVNHASKCISSTNKPIEGWMTRFPKFSIVGAQKAGTKALRFLLDEHPQVAKSCGKHGMVELHYFDRVKPNVEGAFSQQELQEGYSARIEEKCGTNLDVVRNDEKMVFFDDSPKYLFDTPRVPPLFLCAVPWAKTVAVLRNPVDRAYSQYVFKHGEYCTEKTFDEWVEHDIATMTRVGLLKEGISLSEEYEAYGRYFASEEMTGESRFCSFVGRGLYALQVLHWFAAMDGYGVGRDNMMVIHSNDLKGERRRETFNKTIAFLGLDPHHLSNGETFEPKSDYGDKPVFLNSTRLRLEKFFKPYNQRLYRMLAWDPVWDRHHAT
jgi:hypothetical protein